MQYNTDRKDVVMPEYGRNVQKLVQFAMGIEDKKKRQDAVEQIIILMEQINPNSKSVGDYHHKLWDHLFIISDFQLECDSPYPKPTRETVFKKPEKFPYPKQKIKYRHYGKNIERMMNRAIAMEDPEKKEGYTELIGSFMKRTYESYHNEPVNDAIIKEDLVRMSGGALSLQEDQRIIVKGGSPIRRNRNNRKGGKRNNNNNRRKNNNKKNYRR